MIDDTLALANNYTVYFVKLSKTWKGKYCRPNPNKISTLVLHRIQYQS